MIFRPSAPSVQPGEAASASLTAAFALLTTASLVVDALRSPALDDVSDIGAILTTEIEVSTCPPGDSSSPGPFRSHWDRDGPGAAAAAASGGGSGGGVSQDDACVLYPRTKGPRPMGAKLIHLAHADAAGISDRFVNLSDRANNGGLESAALYESIIELESTGDKLNEVISKADLYAWAGKFAVEYMASFSVVRRTRGTN